MKICKKFHEPIAYSSEKCPLCEERKREAAELDKIVEAITKFRGLYPVT